MGSPGILEWVAYPFSSRSSQFRNRTGVSSIPSGFFTNWAIREAHWVLHVSIYPFLVARYSWPLSAGVLQALLCQKVYSWCIHGERCTPHPPTPLPSCSSPFFLFLNLLINHKIPLHYFPLKFNDKNSFVASTYHWGAIERSLFRVKVSKIDLFCSNTQLFRPQISILLFTSFALILFIHPFSKSNHVLVFLLLFCQSPCNYHLFT